MSQENQGAPSCPDQPPSVTDPTLIRNVAVVGAAAVGKTTLIAGLVTATGDRSVHSEPAATDHLTVTPIRFRNVKINLIDAPGHADFAGDRRAALRACDAALFVVAAGTGLDLASQQLWEDCSVRDIPRAVVVTHLDHPRADVDETVALCQRLFGETVVPAHLPLLGDDGVAVAGLIGLATQQIFDYSTGNPPSVIEPEAVHLEGIAEARETLVAAILSESDDESLMDRYIDGDDIDATVLVSELNAAVARAGLHPAIPVDADTGVGLDAVLDLLVDGFPSPVDRPMPTVATVSGDAVEPLSCDPEGPVAAEVIKTTMDNPRVSLLRLYSGSLRSGEPVIVSGETTSGTEVRLPAVQTPTGLAVSEADGLTVAGDICAVSGLTAATGDTISTPAQPLRLERWDVPEPQFPIAIVVNDTTRDEVIAGLEPLVSADPTLRAEPVEDTGQLLLWCMGERHAEVALARLHIEGGPAATEPVRIALRATFTKPANGTGRVARQSAGHGEYAVCRLAVEPLPEGHGIEFTSRVSEETLPARFVAAVEVGVRDRLARGLTGGHRVVDVAVTLLDGEDSLVDSTEAAFEAAGALAVQEAARDGELRLLEAIDHVAVTVADGYARIVRADLANRRGRVVGTDTDEHDRAVIHAEVPAAELRSYVIELRGMTAGSGWFRRRFLRYEPMPSPADD